MCLFRASDYYFCVFIVLVTICIIAKWINLFQKQSPDIFCKKGVLRNFAKFTGKHLCQVSFLRKLQASVASLFSYRTSLMAASNYSVQMIPIKQTTNKLNISVKNTTLPLLRSTGIYYLAYLIWTLELFRQKNAKCCNLISCRLLVR